MVQHHRLPADVCVVHTAPRFTVPYMGAAAHVPELPLPLLRVLLAAAGRNCEVPRRPRFPPTRWEQVLPSLSAGADYRSARPHRPADEDARADADAVVPTYDAELGPRCKPKCAAPTIMCSLPAGRYEAGTVGPGDVSASLFRPGDRLVEASLAALPICAVLRGREPVGRSLGLI